MDIMSARWIGIILVLTLISGAAVYFSLRRDRGETSKGYLLAHRKVGLWEGAIAVAANYVQAPALLTSAQLAYLSSYQVIGYGAAGTLGLFLQGTIAPKIREAMQNAKAEWFTMNEFIGGVLSTRMRALFIFPTFFTLVYVIAFAQVTLKDWVAVVWGIPGWQIIVACTVYGFVCVFLRGVFGGLFLDKVKVGLVALCLAGTAAVLWHYAGTPALPRPANAAPLLSASPWELWTEVPALVVSLLTGAAVTPALAQRQMTIRTAREAGIVYYGGGAFYGATVAVMCLYGWYLAHHLGLAVTPREFPTVRVLQEMVQAKLLAPWVLELLTLILIAILAAAIGSIQDAAGNLMVSEMVRWPAKRFGWNISDRGFIWWARFFTACALAGGTFIAYFDPPLTILLKAVAGFRGEAFMPLIIAALWPRLVPEKYVFWGTLCGLLGGFGFWLCWYIKLSPFFLQNGLTLAALVSFLSPLIGFLLGLLFRTRGSAEVQKA